jgi:polyphosphate kinase
VISVVGRFLEHSRIYYFYNRGNEEIYLGSADLMPRNLNRRVELVFPLEDASLVNYLRDGVLAEYMHDNVKARIMQSDGTYVRRQPDSKEEPLNIQTYLIEQRLAANED